MKIAVGMSGGVDSSVVVRMLKDEDHQIVGLFLKLWSDPFCKVDRQNRCCDYEALEDARAVAGQFGIPFYVINARDEFKKEVVDYFLKEYSLLRTPNPCIVCNDKIKFDLLLKRALSLGCDKLATGHYARILKDSGNPKSEIRNSKQIPNSKSQNSYHLFAGIDNEKDQSYMLYRLSQYQLSRVLFPLGEMTKKEVRAKAMKWDLPVKEKPESQEVCFVGEKDYRVFLRRYLSEEFFKPGEIIDTKGNIIGRHNGLINYTIGQRKGIEQSQKSRPKADQPMAEKIKTGNPDKEPLYVVGFDIKKNQLIVGEDKETYLKEMLVGDLAWINPHTATYEVAAPVGIKIKIRYRHPAVKGKIKLVSGKLVSNKLVSSVIANDFRERGNLSECKIAEPVPRNRGILTSRNDKRKSESQKYLKVLFREPQRAVTPGQSAVIYQGEKVLGGGIIAS